MKKMKRIAAILLVLSMVLGLAGCGNGKDSKVNGGDNTFRIVIVRHTDAWPTEFLEEGIMKELEEKHNIDIEWEIYTTSEWTELKSLLFSSPDDMPDAFLGSNAIMESDIQVYSDQFVELTDLIKEHMPNLTKILEEDGELKTAMTTRDGKIYGLGKKLPFRAASANAPYINKKWLDNLGLEVPTTYKELEAVLQAFKDKDADGDGDPTNEIPYTYCGSLAMDSRHILSPFGTVTSRKGNYMGLDIEGNPFYLPTSANYKEAVIWMHGLFEKGLIDPEYFTQDSSMYTSKLQSSGGSQVGYIFGWTAESAAGANASEFVPMVAVAGPDGNRYVESDPSYLDISGTEFVITKNCSNPELLLQWADDFYTDLVTLQTYYGSIPEQIQDNGDGTYTLLPPEGDLSYDVTAWSNSLRDYGPKYMSDEFAEKVTLPTEGGDGKKLAEDLNAEYARPTFPMVKYKEEDVSKMGTLATNINAYVESQYAHWVVDGGIEKEWDSYLKQLEDMGVQEMIDIHLEAYEYYLDSQTN